MISLLGKSFASGLYFYLSILKNNFIWIFAIAFLVMIFIEDCSDIEEEYMDDKRDIF